MSLFVPVPDSLIYICHIAELTDFAYNYLTKLQNYYMQNPSRHFRSGQNQSANREKSALCGQRVANTYESAGYLKIKM